MKILVVPDKFKGSLSSQEVCKAVATGIAQANSSIEVDTIPFADGGEGSCRILTDLLKGRFVECQARDPLLRLMDSFYGISADGSTAIIELALISGLGLLTDIERNPACTSTVGTGEMILHAIHKGVKKIILAVGGSATNDAGVGIAHALGIKFFDSSGKEFLPVGNTLKDVVCIDFKEFVPEVQQIEFIVLCDVTNPFYGPNGAAHVFAPQKGADKNTVAELDNGLRKIASLIEREFRFNINFPGAGAAGGVGGGARFFLNGKIHSGIEYIISVADLVSRIGTCDLVISGEGKLDHQSTSGKLISGIATICKDHATPLWLVVGQNELSERQVEMLGIRKVIVLADNHPSAEAMTNAFEIIQLKTRKEFELLTAADKW